MIGVDLFLHRNFDPILIKSFRRLLEKTEEIVKKEMAIQEKEKMYIELREILARQPGPEVTEQLSEFQRALRNKTKQLKRIAAELNMSEAAQQEQDMEIHRLAQELQVNILTFVAT